MRTLSGQIPCLLASGAETRGHDEPLEREEIETTTAELARSSDVGSIKIGVFEMRGSR
jgi:hypothetical protein